MSIYAIQSILQIQKSRISPQCLYKFVEYRSRRLLLRAGQYKKFSLYQTSTSQINTVVFIPKNSLVHQR